ncbi:Methyl farnesoate epoxidase [Gryllus bimaculatus]|nr:Methyl farnesoate epoxidase [Gryllus bimaculatus]
MILLIFTVLILCIIYSWIKMKPPNFPPGLPYIPVFGSILFMPKTNGHFQMEQWREQYGGLVGIVFGHLGLSVAVCDPKLVREVLKRDDFLGRPISSFLTERSFNKRIGIIFSDGPGWQEQRRFAFRHLKDLGFGKASMENVILEEIEDLLQEIKDKKVQEVVKEHEKTIDENHPRDFIDVYITEMRSQLGSESSFHRENLITVCSDLFSAGSESVGNTLGFAMLYMVLYPEIQEKVHSIIDSVIGNHRRPTLQDRQMLPYVDAVLMEIQRSNTIAPLTDTVALPSLWCILHDKEHWGDPQIFRPSRFIDDDGKLIKDEIFIPFGIGKRLCPGEALARNTMFLFFTSLMQEFYVQLPPGSTKPSTESLSGFTTAPKPFEVIFKSRHKL